MPSYRSHLLCSISNLTCLLCGFRRERNENCFLSSWNEASIPDAARECSTVVLVHTLSYHGTSRVRNRKCLFNFMPVMNCYRYYVGSACFINRRAPFIQAFTITRSLFLFQWRVRELKQFI